MIVVCQEQNTLFIISDGFRTSRPDYEWPKEGVHFLCAGVSMPEICSRLFIHLNSNREVNLGMREPTHENLAWSWGLRPAMAICKSST